MNLEKFKQFIKNTVKEAVKEAINESLTGVSTNLKVDGKKVKNIMESMNIETPQVNISSNPLLDILNTTAKQMTNEDYKTIGNFNSSDIQVPFNPGMGVNTIAEGSALPSGEVSMDQIMNILQK